MKPLVLIAAPGAGSDGDEGFSLFEAEVRALAGDVDLRWIYTSRALLERVRAVGGSALSPEEGVQLTDEHDGQAIILSLHLLKGREYGHLAVAFESRSRRSTILTSPLLEIDGMIPLLIDALVAANAIEAGEARIFVSHGSPEPEGIAALAALGSEMERRAGLSMLASLLGQPDLAEAAMFCRGRGCSRACLVPLLLTSGASARSLTRNDDPALAAFRDAGIVTRCDARGLLMVPAFRQLWCSVLRRHLR